MVRPGQRCCWISLLITATVLPEKYVIFFPNGGSLGATGCVAWMFNRKGYLAVAAADADEDELMLQALDAGAADFTADDDLYEIYTAPDDFEAVKEKLEAAGYSFTEAEITMIPENTVEVTDLDDARKVVSLIEALEDHDDCKMCILLDLPSKWLIMNS